MFTSTFEFYHSKQWESFANNLKTERIAKDGQIICSLCGKPIVKKYDCIAHHKIHLTAENINDYTISFNPDLIELIHFSCHNSLHTRAKNNFKQNVFIVYGAPCAGKSTWVRANATEDDLIVDIDNIWKCISTCDKYHKPPRLKANVFGIRDTLIDQIKTRKGNWRNAYLIGGYPLATERQRLSQLLRADLIFIDEDYDTCISRAKNENWENFIKEWFENYSE